MRLTKLAYVSGLLAAFTVAATQSYGDDTVDPNVELQSDALTPAMELPESPRPVYQVRLLVDAQAMRAMLILDGNSPKFDEYGGLIGGLRSPHVREEGDPELMTHLRCRIELIGERPDKWRLYRLQNPNLRTPLRVATRSSINGAGPARILVLDANENVSAVIDCTRYGLVVP